MNNLPLRERKKYQTMSSILDTFISSLKTSNFNDILIEDICKEINISKVTFFRYFSSKEEVLDYFVLRWCYQRSLEIHRDEFAGLEGIYHIFESTAEMPNSEKVFVALINYYSKLKEKPTPKHLNIFKRYVISNETDDINIKLLTLNEIITHYLIQTSEVKKECRDAYLNHLVTLFYGVPFQVHIEMLGEKSLTNAYKQHLDLLFNRL